MPAFQDRFEVDGRSVYVYGRPQNLHAHGQKLPLVLDLNCTTGNARAEAMSNGWQDLAQQKNLIVVAPEYDDYATYSETAYFLKVIQTAEQRYQVDHERIYSVGFSNGGASSVALASTYPNLLAGIGAMGWMIGFARHRHVEVPFVLIQGSREFIDHRPDGTKAVMDDEKTALHDLFAGNGMLTGPADYNAFPYWGYRPGKSYQRRFSYVDYDWQGHNPRRVNNVLNFADYFKTDFTHPLARLVLVPDEPHLPHSVNASITWDVLKHFKREKGKLMEIA